MTKIIVTTEEELTGIIEKVLDRRVTDTEPSPERMDIYGVIKFLNQSGYPTSKAKIYELTSAHKIPFSKYGNRLIFSREDILRWADQQLLSKSTDHDLRKTMARKKITY